MMYETETSDSKRTRAVGVEQQQINLGSEHFFSNIFLVYYHFSISKKTNFITLLTKSQTKPKQRFNFEQDPKKPTDELDRL